MPSTHPLQLLVLEDNPVDADVLIDTLREAGFVFEAVCVEKEGEFISHLNGQVDLILADYTLPQFNALEALKILQSRGLDIPFIVVTGTVSEETAVECMRQGAADYLLKDRLVRLGPAVKQALHEKTLRQEKRESKDALEASQKRLSAITELGHEGTILLNAEGQILYESPGVGRLWGYADGQRVGLNAFDSIQIDDTERATTLFSQLLNESNSTIQTEIHVRHADGSWRWIEINATNQLFNPEIGAVVVKFRDMTQRWQADEEIRRLKDFNENIVQSMTEGIVITDAEGRITFINPAAAAIAGYTTDEVLGLGAHGSRLFVSPDQYAALDNATERRKGGQVSRYELEILCKDGSRRTILISNRLRFDDERFVGTLAVLTDITAQKKVELELRKLHTAVEQSASSVVITDLQGNIEYINSRFTEVTGYEPDEVIGKNPRILQSGQTPPEVYKELWNRITTGNQWTGEFCNRKKNGELFWEVASISPIKDLAGQTTHFLAVKEDITSRKQLETQLAEERKLLRTVIDSLPDRIYAKDTEGRYILKNQAGARQMGAASADEVIGKTDFDYYAPDVANRYFADDQRVIASGRPLIDREEPVVRADQTQRWILSSKFPFRDVQGNIVGLVGVGRDITSRKLAEDKILSLNRTLAIINAVNQTIIRHESVQELFTNICRIAVETGGLRMAWVGLLDHEMTRIDPIAGAGTTGDYLEKLDIRKNDPIRWGGPAGQVVNTGVHCITNDIACDPGLVPWRADALRLGYQTSAVFPLKVDGKTRGILSLYAENTGFFDADEIRLLDEMAANISFAMEFDEHEVLRKQAGTALQKHVEVIEEMRLFLQTALDAFPADSAVLNVDGSIITVNQPWVRFAIENNGSSPVQYLGSNYLAVCDQSSGPNSEEAKLVAAGIRAVIAGQNDDYNLEYPCHSPSEKRWFLMQVTPFAESAPRRVLVAHINISERKQAEEQLQMAHDLLEQRVIERTAELVISKQQTEAIVNNSPVGIVLLSPDCRIQGTNPTFDKLFASQPDGYLNTSLFDLIFEDDVEKIKNYLESGTTSKRHPPIEIRVRRQDNTFFDSELSVGYVPNGDLVCTINDIAIRKQAEEKLQHALEKEKELSELKSRFVSMASHEFRTPLATILATTETLITYRQRLTEDQIGQKFIKIKDQVNHLKDIMEDMLYLSRMQARKVEFNPGILDIDVLTQTIIEEFQSRPDVNHQIIYHYDGLAPNACLDSKLIRQILGNLLSNAIKYSASDKPVTVHLDAKQAAVVLSVADEGLGIPDSDLPHLFESFHRGDNVRNIPGTGLGLVITKESVELHGGSIAVASEIGIGTTFTVTIPTAGRNNIQSTDG